MTSLRPCRRCHRRETCPIRADTLKALRGLSITLANVRCKIPAQDFPIGCTVKVKAFEIDEEFENKYHVVRVGIVRSWTRGYAAVVLNAGQEIDKLAEQNGKIGYLKKVEPDRLERVDVPIVELCRCGISAQRCEENDYPPVRNGEWQCWDHIE